MTPPRITPAVFRWPTTLYVSALVAPITRNVDSVTSRPSAAESSTVSSASGVGSNAVTVGSAEPGGAVRKGDRMASGSMRGSAVARRHAAIGLKRRHSWLESARAAGGGECASRACCALVGHNLDGELGSRRSGELQRYAQHVRAHHETQAWRPSGWSCYCADMKHRSWIGAPLRVSTVSS